MAVCQAKLMNAYLTEGHLTIRIIAERRDLSCKEDDLWLQRDRRLFLNCTASITLACLVLFYSRQELYELCESLDSVLVG